MPEDTVWSDGPASVPNAADPAQIKTASLRLDRTNDQARADLLWLMGDPRGRRFMARLLATCGVNRDGFAPDALQMAETAGRRFVGLMLQQDIGAADPELYLTMLREGLDQRKRDDATQQASQVPQ